VARDPYAVLGLSKNASPEDIKKAYRKLSKELHPDKHKGEKDAETKFKEINEAYEILSNPDKKKMFDQFGRTDNGAGGGGQGFGGFDFSNFQGFQQNGDLGDLFESFFGRRGGARPVDQNQGSNHESQVEITLADVLHGTQKTIEVRRLIACDTCHGSGAAPGSSVVQCTTCGGTGQVTRTTQSFFGAVQQRMVCDTCGGSGTVPREPCKTCRGEGRVPQRSSITVNIPAGISSGQTLHVRGQGDAGRRGAPAGDLYVHVRVAPHPRFEREGSDIHSSIAIHVLDAILGAEIPVETLHGTTTVNIAAGLQPGQVLRIKGKGVPELGSSRYGDHYVTVVVEIPKKLSREEKKILEEWKKAQSL
jgi:molecular chaperone DnaJ